MRIPSWEKTTSRLVHLKRTNILTRLFVGQWDDSIRIALKLSFRVSVTVTAPARLGHCHLQGICSAWLCGNSRHYIYIYILQWYCETSDFAKSLKFSVSSRNHWFTQEFHKIPNYFSDFMKSLKKQSRYFMKSIIPVIL